MHDSFVDFLNHGVLPFVGRAAEQQRVVQFWEQTGDQFDRLRAMLIIGEAGSGKSRLIDETKPRLEERGGVIAHIKLRPEAAVSLGPLLAAAVESSESARHLQRGKPEPTLQAGIATLRRLCGLRRTLLIVEDIHLLIGPTLREFSLLLEALSDEPLAVLLATRPLETGGRAVAEHHLSEELLLKGFSISDLHQLWQQLFAEHATEELATLLLTTTHGNALALRSALRGGLRSGAIHWQPQLDSQRRVQVNVAILTGVARRSSEGIVGGMIADLSAEQLQTARQLAMLGEVFAQEAAMALIDHPEQSIRTLIFRGILMHSSTAVTPLNGHHGNDLPLAFTHTLLHDALVASVTESAEVPTNDVERLATVIAKGLPIYSQLPFRMLGSHAGFVAGLPIYRDVVTAMADIARQLNQTADWQSAIAVMETAAAITAACRNAYLPSNSYYPQYPFDQQDLDYALQCQVVATQLDVNLRSDHAESHRALAQHLWELTEGIHDIQILSYRIHALEHLYRYLVASDPSQCQHLFATAQEITKQFSELEITPEYRRFLHNVGTHASNRNDITTLRSLEAIVNDVLHRHSNNTDACRQMLRIMGGYFLGLINNAAEQERRRDLLATLEGWIPQLHPEFHQSDLMFYFLRANYFLYCGNAEQLLQATSILLPLSKIHALYSSYATMLRHLIVARGLLGESALELVQQSQDAIAEIEQLEATHPSFTPTNMRTTMGRVLHNIGLFRGDLALMQTAVDRFVGSEQNLAIANQLLLLLWEQRFAEFAQLAKTLPQPQRQQALICSDQPIEVETVMAQFCETLDLRDYAIHNAFRTYIIISLVEYGVAHHRLQPTEQLRNSIHNALVYHLELFAQYHLSPCIIALLERYGHYLAADNFAMWKQHLANVVVVEKKMSGAHSQTIHISLIDTILLQVEGKNPQRIRGGRNQTLLGLLVANKMLHRPLERQEFAAIASGITNDPQRARVTSNVAVMRLREAIGRDAVTNHNDTPELNLQIIRVDLLEAWAAMHNADDALRRGRPGIACQQIIIALQIAAGKIPFPTLYHELFENLRSEVEYRLRDIALRTAHHLIAAGDINGAQELLHITRVAIPEDEEIKQMIEKNIANIHETT